MVSVSTSVAVGDGVTLPSKISTSPEVRTIRVGDQFNGLIQRVFRPPPVHVYEPEASSFWILPTPWALLIVASVGVSRLTEKSSLGSTCRSPLTWTEIVWSVSAGVRNRVPEVAA